MTAFVNDFEAVVLGENVLLQQRFLYACYQGTMLQAIERYMKQAIVDKVSSVSSSALVSSLVSEQAAACF